MTGRQRRCSEPPRRDTVNISRALLVSCSQTGDFTPGGPTVPRRPHPQDDCRDWDLDLMVKAATKSPSKTLTNGQTCRRGDLSQPFVPKQTTPSQVGWTVCYDAAKPPMLDQGPTNTSESTRFPRSRLVGEEANHCTGHGIGLNSGAQEFVWKAKLENLPDSDGNRRRLDSNGCGVTSHHGESRDAVSLPFFARKTAESQRPRGWT